MSGNAHHERTSGVRAPHPYELERARRALQAKIDTENIIAMVQGRLVTARACENGGIAAGSRAIRYYAESRANQDPSKPSLVGPWVTRQQAILEFPAEHQAFVAEESARMAREQIALVPDEAPGGKVIQMFAEDPRSAVQ